MHLGIMQPYFFPYLGYFAIIKKSDLFILFDTPQFIRHGWMDRNQILKPNGEPLYIKVPVEKHSRNTPINEIKIKNTTDWKGKILAQLTPYKKKAPYYQQVVALLEEIFEFDTTSLSDMNRYSLQKTCEYLGIDTPIKVWSKMEVPIEEVKEPDEWALEITRALGGNRYYNPPGGRSFFNRSKYVEAGIDLYFLEMEQEEYRQLGDDFVPRLSIIDVLMFNSAEEVMKMLDNHTIAP